jgi:uncharacterized membrane protein
VNSNILIERYVNASIVLLIGAIQYAIPALTRPDLFFAVTVQPDFRRTEEGRSIQRSYRIAVVIHTLIALAITFLTWVPVGIFWLLAGTGIAYLMARKRVIPHGVTPSMEREASLTPDRGRMPGGWLIHAGPLLMMLAVAVILRMRWSDIPPRFPVHWGFDGRANGWAPRTILGVYLPLIIGAATCAFIMLIAVAISTARKVHASGSAGDAEARFRRTIVLILAAVEYTIAFAFSFVAFLPLRSDPARQPSLMLLVGPILIVVVFAIIASLRIGQGGSRLAPVAADAGGRPAGDRTLDRYWKAGMFYVNRDDPAWLVEKRFGVGYTLNFGNPRSWIAVAVLLLFIAFSTMLPHWVG